MLHLNAITSPDLYHLVQLSLGAGDKSDGDKQEVDDSLYFDPSGVVRMSNKQVWWLGSRMGIQGTG